MRRRASEGGQAVRRLDGQILSFVLCLLTAYPPIRLSAQQVNNSGALFLVFPVGARAVGMGQTAAALDGRGEAAFWNPAGLATLKKNERSEEHTSELQSRLHLVCRLLLEKKNNQYLEVARDPNRLYE